MGSLGKGSDMDIVVGDKGRGGTNTPVDVVEDGSLHPRRAPISCHSPRSAWGLGAGAHCAALGLSCGAGNPQMSKYFRWKKMVNKSNAETEN